MCSRPYIFVSEITGIPVSFCYRKYRIAFVSDEKNMKVKVVEPFADRFRPFSSLSVPRAAVAGELGSVSTGRRGWLPSIKLSVFIIL
jgi:hypothetical protein